MSDLDQVAHLQAEIWGSAEVAAPATLLKVMSTAGGIVLLAESELGGVGFAYGFTGRGPSGRVYHRSHAAGVVDSARNAGVGRALKLAQREKALEQGLTVMVWTFDPAQTGNAHFNLNRLGAKARSFRRDYYGTRSDALNRGRLSDRMVVEWLLEDGAMEAVNHCCSSPPVSVPVPAQLRNPAVAGDLKAGYRALRVGLEAEFAKGLAAVAYDREAGAYSFALLPPGTPEPVE
ncbi:MAG: hypothetical protein ACYDC5_09835 [Candidatus Dormibacteria bacterium]